MSDPARRKPVWPPMKDDLEGLYLVEKLSAAKIAKVYGLKYKNPKVAESTILHHLKRNGIERRDRAEHVRKVNEAMVDKWAGRYKAGESLKQIASGEVGPVTVWNHLKARGLVLRDKVEAQIQAVSKYERKPFQGNDVEKAYLVGLRYGDLHAVRHGRAIRVRVSTTHPAMAELFENLFSPYCHIYRYPRRAKLLAFEWTLECDLDESFGFLLLKPSIFELESLDDHLFLAFLAGFFDAEGSVLMHKKGTRYDPEISIPNSDRELIELVFRRLRGMGFSAHAIWFKQKTDRSGISGESMIGRVNIWKFKEIQDLLRRLPLRHREKVSKVALVLGLSSGRVEYRPGGVMERWLNLRQSIRDERRRFLEDAAVAISRRKERFPAPSALEELESK